MKCRVIRGREIGENKKIIKFAIAVFAIQFAAACAGNPSLRINPGVDLNFWNGTMDPYLNYYTFGSAREPDVIIGVQRNLLLAGDSIWQPLSPATPENLSMLAQMMYYRWHRKQKAVQGYSMFDDKGKYVGEWYAPAEYVTEIYSRGSDKVEISPPSPTLANPFLVPWDGMNPVIY